MVNICSCSLASEYNSMSASAPASSVSSTMDPTTNPVSILLTIVVLGTTLFITGGALALLPQQPHGSSGTCIPAERDALLSFKKGMTSDPANLLTSWRGQDCCQWRGVICNNKTGHVTKLHLRNPNPSPTLGCVYDNALTGEISPSLLSLEYLEHMDLRSNCLGGANGCMPVFLGSMKNMKYLDLSGIPFTGRVAPQLGNLSKLQYLALGRPYNNLYSADISWLTNLPYLQYLDMSYVNLSDVADWPQTLNMIPSLKIIHLSSSDLASTNQSLLYFNLTKLENLDLSWNDFNHEIASSWFWKASLKYLKVEGTNLFGHLNDALENMSSLQVLDLSYKYNNYLTWTGNLISLGNLKNVCSLEILDLTQSYTIVGDLTIFMERLAQCTWGKLRELHLNNNNFTGALPNLIGHFTRLRVLEISNNSLSGRIPPGLGNCKHLTTIDLSNNKIIGPLPPEIRYLTSLSSFHVNDNNLSGSILTEIATLIKLTSLDLSNNNLRGSVPNQIGKFTNLIFLDISNNNFSGVITEEHLEGLIRLKVLDLSSNNNLKVRVSADWLPPFRLEYGIFANCQIGPLFPAWLQQQLQIIKLDITRTALKGNIPHWFWSTFSQARSLSISNNELIGSLPEHLDGMAVLDLNMSSNQLTGPIPSLPRNIMVLDISNNFFSGTLPLYFHTRQLSTLLMFSNQIVGTIPESICQLQLFDLDLSNNLLEGKIPQCFEAQQLQFFLLSNNSLSGIFPAFLETTSELLFLDLAWNKFSGRLPTWIGELTALQILSLSHNAFSGSIPHEITCLNNLQYLDLSGNNLSGIIPRQLSKLTGMTLKGYQPLRSTTNTTVQIGNLTEDITVAGQFGEVFLIFTKGQQLRYGRGFSYFVGIDLSCNSLTGEIPRDVMYLDALINLNLSSNHLSGGIPYTIGAMKSLESLDLSKNKLSGEIPSSLSSLTSLSYLNLSYNNFSGRIPSGHQLDTLNTDNPVLMYIGNPRLCGPPVPTNCSDNHATFIHGYQTNIWKELELPTFYFGLGLGLVLGLWMVFCGLLFKKTWRIAYFRYIDKLNDRIYVSVAVRWARLTRKAELRLAT